MSLHWPEPGTKQQSVLHTILLILGEGLLFTWGVIPAVADWYGSIGSATPNVATGQTSLIKGIHAVG
jgi:hypothetical protein